MGSLFLRFGPSSLHQRDPRSALFEGYDSGAGDRTRNGSSSPSRLGYGGPYGYPGSGNGSAGLVLGSEKPAYRPATPNSRYVAMSSTGPQFWGTGHRLTGQLRGQYSDAVLNELESQNDGQVEGIMGKVRQLKDVRSIVPEVLKARSRKTLTSKLL